MPFIWRIGKGECEEKNGKKGSENDLRNGVEDWEGSVYILTHENTKVRKSDSRLEHL